MVEPVIEVPRIAVGAECVPPAGARLPVPPLPPVTQIDGTIGRPEHQRSRHQIDRRHARIQRGIQRLFGDGEIASGVDEFGELRIGHRVTFDGERADGHGVRGRLFRIELR